MTNPYESPTISADDTVDAKSLLRLPAIFLLLLAVPTVLMELPVSHSMFVDTLRFMEQYGPVMGVVYIAPFVLIYLLILAAHIAVIFGAISMLMTRGYRFAVTAAVLSIIPILTPCYLLGIPLGIWALVTLRNPGVRDAFFANRI